MAFEPRRYVNEERLGTRKRLAFLNRTIHKDCDKTDVMFTVVREINSGFILYLL
jgi:hypothetical protein